VSEWAAGEGEGACDPRVAWCDRGASDRTDRSRAEVLREVMRIASGLENEEFARDLLPRLRRLTAEQRREVGEALARMLAGARGAGDFQPA